MTTTVLIVDSELPVASALARDLARAGDRLAEEGRAIDVTALANFSKARSRLKARPPALLVTALQLRERVVACLRGVLIMAETVAHSGCVSFTYDRSCAVTFTYD